MVCQFEYIEKKRLTWIFPLSGLAMVGMALITLSVQTIKTAMANPAKSLNTE